MKESDNLQYGVTSDENLIGRWESKSGMIETINETIEMIKKGQEKEKDQIEIWSHNSEFIEKIRKALEQELSNG